MIGTIVNTITIILGSLLGSLFKKGIKQEYQGAMLTAMGLAATALGANAVVSNMPKKCLSSVIYCQSGYRKSCRNSYKYRQKISKLNGKNIQKSGFGGRGLF